MATEQVLKTALEREWEDGPPMLLIYDRIAVSTIVGALQLALRHPGLAATQAQRRSFAA